MVRLLRVIILLVFIITPAVITAEPDAQEGGLQVTTTARLKLRDGPGTAWYILGYVEQGDLVRLDGRAAFDLWVRGITTDGRIGWMHGAYLAAPRDQLLSLRIISREDTFMLDAAFNASSSPVMPLGVRDFAPLPDSAPARYDVLSGIGANTRAIFRRGQQMGSRPGVFSKVGDSITVSPRFLSPIAWGAYNLRDYGYLQPVIDHFSAAGVRTANSFANESLAAGSGWTTATLLSPDYANPHECLPGESPLVCEYRVSRPALALIMIGTNDLTILSLDEYRSNLNTIIKTTADMGIIPVLSTIPPRDYIDTTAFNRVVVQTARTQAVPLWDYGSRMFALPQNGIGDGIHPSYPAGSHADDYGAAADFTPENLQFGYTLRNLTALQVLDAIWRNVLS